MRHLPRSSPLPSAAARVIVSVLVCVAAGLSGCAETSLPSLTTGSLFGGTQAQPQAAPTKPELRNDPLARPLQVSRVAARAQRCGFNFDAPKLKSNFMTSEGAQPGADAASLAKLDQNYSVTYSATLKVISGEEGYCSDGRNAHIKADLTRHLAGDYAPSRALALAEDPSVFSFGGGLFGGETPAE